MYSAYKLNKQGDNIQPWCTPFPIWSIQSWLGPVDLPDPGIEPAYPALAGRFFTAEPPGKPYKSYTSRIYTRSSAPFPLLIYWARIHVRIDHISLTTWPKSALYIAGYVKLVRNVWELLGWFLPGRGQFCILISSQNVSPLGTTSDTGISETCWTVLPSLFSDRKVKVHFVFSFDWLVVFWPCVDQPLVPFEVCVDDLAPQCSTCCFHGNPGPGTFAMLLHSHPLVMTPSISV